MKSHLKEEQPITEGVSITVDNDVFKVKGPKGELERKALLPGIIVKVEGDNVVFERKNSTQREKKIVKSQLAHIRNLMKGVTEGYVYKLKVCSGHFPMTVAVKGKLLEIKNFIGEHVPRTVEISEGVNVKVDGQIIIVEGIDKELVSQTAARIEQTTRRPNFDKRIFQDGIYIIQKDNKEIK